MSWCSRGMRRAGKPDQVPGSRTTSVSRWGFPEQELANRAFIQAEKFGARISIARSATGLKTGGPAYTVELDDGKSVRARTIIMAAGGRYRRLDLPNLAQFEGVGIYYGATRVEAEFCRERRDRRGGRRKLGGASRDVSVGNRQARVSSGARTLPREDHVAILDFPDRSEPADHAHDLDADPGARRRHGPGACSLAKHQDGRERRL